MPSRTQPQKERSGRVNRNSSQHLQLDAPTTKQDGRLDQNSPKSRSNRDNDQQPARGIKTEEPNTSSARYSNKNDNQHEQPNASPVQPQVESSDSERAGTSRNWRFPFEELIRSRGHTLRKREDNGTRNRSSQGTPHDNNGTRERAKSHGLPPLRDENFDDSSQETKEDQTKTPKKPDDDDDPLEVVLSYVSDMGRYQWLLFFVMMPSGMVLSFVYFVQMFIAATPQAHWCRVPELAHLNLELRRNLSAPGAHLGKWNKCRTYDANWTQVRETLIPPDSKTRLVPCAHGWEFQLGDIPYETVVSERGWVCEKAKYIPLTQAIFFAGSFIGGILFGWLADTYGRVPAIVGVHVIGFVGGAATTFTSGFWDFLFARFITGMAFDSCFMIIYILVLEYVSPRRRTVVANISNGIYFGGSCVLLPWLALWTSDWRLLVWVTTLPTLIAILLTWVVPESARWLASKGRVNQAVEVLRRFEKVNRVKIPQEAMDDFIESTRQTSTTNESITTLVKNPYLRIVLILMLVVYMSNALVFDGIVRMSEGLGLDFFITFTLTSATEIPANVLLVLLLDRWGRRWLTCGPLTIAGTLILTAACVPRGVPVVTLAIIARFAINMAYNTAVQWSTELLPTGLRASGSSLIHASGYVATVFSPFVVYSERLWQPLPFLMLGVLALAGAAAGALLPETKGLAMPQTIADGETLFKEYSLCGKPEVAESSTSNKDDNSIKISPTLSR